MVSVLVPLGYLVALFGSLAVFSKYYRKKQLESKASKASWFPPHLSRDIYISLLSLDPPPPNHILVAALLQRATEDVRRIWSIRDSKASLTILLQKGQIGDDLWERFLLAEKELEAEIVEVVGEANHFQPGYGQNVFALASEMVTHQKWKDVYQDIKKEREIATTKYSQKTPFSPILHPLSHLTPTSLTLFPSNPLSASLPTTTTTTPSSTEPINPASLLIPSLALPEAPPEPILPPTPTPSTPTSTPRRNPTNSGSPVASTSTARFPSTPGSTDPGTSTSATGGSAKKGSARKGKKKPAVKGGR